MTKISLDERVRVSVLIPMHNAEPFIVKTLTSVLQEKDISMEVVVINDKSTDRSLEQVLSICDKRIRIVDGPGAGISACMNAGLSVAKGEIIMRCDADDLYPTGRIKEQITWLDENPEYDAVCGSFSVIDPSGRLVANLSPGSSIEDITEELNSGKTRTHLCTFAIRKTTLEDVGSFRPYFVTAEDIDYQLRLGEAAKVMYLPNYYYFYRLHEASITHIQGSNKREFFEATARQFQSQRKITGQDDLDRECPPSPPEVQSDKPKRAAEHIHGMLTGAAWREHEAGNKLKAVGIGYRALIQSPLDSGSWKSLLGLLVKPVKKSS